MSRRPRQTYRCEALGNLTRQLLRFAPPEKRIEQVERAERLHDEIDPAGTYPYEYIAYRVTGYRSDAEAETLLVGEALLPDLRLLIDTLSRSVAIARSEEEVVETVDELAARLNVSTKTISRWRQSGLRWRWMQGGHDGRLQLVLPRVAVERFLAQNERRVARAMTFTQLSAAERKRIIERARRIVQRREEVTLNQVATHLARRIGRAVETVRQLLEQHDRTKPKQAIFGHHTGPLTTRQQRICARAHRMGVSVEKIAARFGRSRTTIYRVIHQRRAAALRRLHIEFVHAPIFDRDDADELILAADPDAAEDAGKSPRRGPRVSDLPEALQTLYAQPPLGAMQQQLLFRRFNYLKFKAARLREALDRYEPRVADLDAIEAALKEAAAIGERLHGANRPVVLTVARKHLVGTSDPSIDHLLELLQRGEDLLHEAIATFSQWRADFTKYLTYRLMKGFVGGDKVRG